MEDDGNRIIPPCRKPKTGGYGENAVQAAALTDERGRARRPASRGGIGHRFNAIGKYVVHAQGQRMISGGPPFFRAMQDAAEKPLHKRNNVSVRPGCTLTPQRDDLCANSGSNASKALLEVVPIIPILGN